MARTSNALQGLGSDPRKREGQDSTHCIKVAKPMRKRLTLPDEVCEKQETNKKMIRSLLRRIVVECDIL